MTETSLHWPNRDAHRAALDILTDEQLDSLESALGNRDALWCSAHRAEWLFDEAVRRGWLKEIDAPR